VFVPHSFQLKTSIGASISILSTDLLHDESIIEQTLETRTCITEALAEQYFGMFLFSKHLSDSWLLIGLCKYLANQFLRQNLGQNETLYQMKVNEKEKTKKKS